MNAGNRLSPTCVFFRMSTAALSLGVFGVPASGRRSVSSLRARTENPAQARPAATAAARGQVEQDWPAIARRCLHGDPAAWNELVVAHHGRVYSLCYRFTGSTHDAEDLTQDIFLKIYGNLKAFEPTRGSLVVWVTTMTRNHLVDHYRRSRLERASESIDAGWDEPDANSAPVRLEDTRPGPHSHALQRELEREVQAALANVSPELREAVILRDLQDMDYKDIAAVLRIPEGTVKSRISRGRAELARILAQSPGRKGKQVN